jgi:hypothetical protein
MNCHIEVKQERGVKRSKEMRRKEKRRKVKMKIKKRMKGRHGYRHIETDIPVGGVEGLLHPVSVVDVDVYVEHALVVL